GMIVKQCKPTEDHAWTKGTHGGDEGGEHHESETAIEEEPRGACQDGEQVPHAIPPGLQVRLAIALITAQRNGYFHDLGASPYRVAEQLCGELHARRGDFPGRQLVTAEGPETTVAISQLAAKEAVDHGGEDRSAETSVQDWHGPGLNVPLETRPDHHVGVGVTEGLH